MDKLSREFTDTFYGKSLYYEIEHEDNSCSQAKDVEKLVKYIPENYLDGKCIENKEEGMISDNSKYVKYFCVDDNHISFYYRDRLC